MPAEYVRRPNVPPESPTLGLTHLQFEALLATARLSPNRNDFPLVAMLGLLGLRIFEACGANIEDLGEEHGHRVLRVPGKGGKVVLTPLPPAVARAIERAVDGRQAGPILRTRRGTRMDRHCATRRLRRLAENGGVHAARMHTHMLRYTFVTTLLDAGVHGLWYLARTASEPLAAAPTSRRRAPPKLSTMGSGSRTAHRRLKDQREAILHLVRAHKGRSVAVVGSVARSENTADSDIDLLVEFEPASSLLDLIDLEEALQHLLGTRVDVISAGALLDRDIEIRRDAVPL